VNNKIHIIKASGERQVFDEKKIYDTARRAGASEKLAEKVRDAVQKKLYPNISSDKILNYVLSYLNKKENKIASRYSLKKAIMELGPSGYSFEKYIAIILKEYGYQVKTNQFIKGHCLTYEIDVVAEKDNKVFVVECKYHNHPGLRSDSKVALYSHARFLDIEKAWKKKSGKICDPCKKLLITNTRCTSDAIKYAECVGMGIIGWHYPKKQSLEYLIEQKKLYPITCLVSLKRQARDALISNDIILTKDLLSIDLSILSNKSGIPLEKLKLFQFQAKDLQNN
jgi:Holliday junction resolvase-like predicted endonuclease